MRAIFFSEEDAREAVSRLRRGGYEAEAARERLQGEDDDEDHPWAVLSDAPMLTLELLVDEFDGWLDVEEPDAPAPAEPWVLPTSPRRVKRPDLGSGA